MLLPTKQKAASSVDDFCDRNGIGRTTFYKEVGAGRLKVRKLGRKTLVLAEDEALWLASLPVFQAREAA